MTGASNTGGKSKIEELTLSDVMTIDESSPIALRNLQNATITNLGSAFNELTLDEMIDGSELQLIGVIWEDPFTRNAMDSGEPLDDAGVNYETFRALAERIRGKYIPLGFK